MHVCPLQAFARALGSAHTDAPAHTRRWRSTLEALKLSGR
jgi:hypothetical protein